MAFAQEAGSMSQETHVIRIGADGRVIINMPEMAGQYLLVQQGDGQLILKPLDLRTQPNACSIAKVGSKLHVIRREGDYPMA
jgi:hypothetical protein